MVLRVFTYIWGTLLMTMLSFATLVSVLDWGAPESAMRHVDREITQRDLDHIARTEGIAAARAHWDRIAPLHPVLQVTLPDACPSDTGAACVSVTLPTGARSFAINISPFLLPMMIGAAVSALAAIVMSQRLTRPIRTVSLALQRLALGQLDTRIAGEMPAADGEMARLAAAFDNAAERLQDLTESRQRLFHDVSHEIRSPLARLRAAVGLLDLRPERLPAMRAQMETDIARLDYLVEGILTLARFDSGQSMADVEDLDLLDILEPILSDANFEGEQRSVRVLYRGAEQLCLRGQAEMLHRAFENVVRNALTYSPQGGDITVRGTIEAGTVVIEVQDAGPGVEESEQARLFQPFLRGSNADPSRGTGLGLAIAAKAVSLHDGRIEARRATPTGLIVRITLPV